MSSLDLEEPWGLLVLVEGGEEVRVPMVGNRLTIGRGKGADVTTDNKLVSTFHCTLLRGEDGLVWIRDTSTNGTLLNGKKLEKNKEVQLSNGDIIRIVFRKEQPDCNVSYRFHDLRPSEPDTTLPLSEATIEMTQEYQEVDLTKGDEAASKKRPLEGGEGPPSAKLVAAGETKPDAEKEEGEKKGNPNTKGLAEAAPSKPELIKKDSIEETLLCEICQEILHDCVSLQPCMHSYCAGCYSDWMGHSNTCPACRNVVERISKNHIVNNLVEAYLRAHPDKKRPEEDLKELDGKNKITKDMLYPKKKRRRYYDDDDDDADDYSDGSSSRSPTPIPPHFTFTPLFTAHTHVPPAPLFLCRQCPSYVDIGLSSTSHPSPPPFTCSPDTNHVLCMCCLQPMPDRRHDTDLSIPPQKCDICGQAYCHMYWGCRKVGCRGCLNLFKDMDFDESCLTSLLNNGNLYESRILKDYLQSNGLSVKDLLDACCQQLDRGEYHCTDSRTARISSTTRTCYKCATKNFQDLAYLYRRDIPNDDLPAEVTSRSDCYWGRNCRTQRNKPHHAERFNHICEQMRRS